MVFYPDEVRRGDTLVAVRTEDRVRSTAGCSPTILGSPYRSSWPLLLDDHAPLPVLRIAHDVDQVLVAAPAGAYDMLHHEHMPEMSPQGG